MDDTSRTEAYRAIMLSPDGEILLCAAGGDGSALDKTLYLCSLRDGSERKVCVAELNGRVSDARWDATGKLVALAFDRQGDLDVFVLSRDDLALARTGARPSWKETGKYFCLEWLAGGLLSYVWTATPKGIKEHASGATCVTIQNFASQDYTDQNVVPDDELRVYCLERQMEVTLAAAPEISCIYTHDNTVIAVCHASRADRHHVTSKEYFLRLFVRGDGLNFSASRYRSHAHALSLAGDYLAIMSVHRHGSLVQIIATGTGLSINLLSGSRPKRSVTSLIWVSRRMLLLRAPFSGQGGSLSSQAIILDDGRRTFAFVEVPFAATVLHATKQFSVILHSSGILERHNWEDGQAKVLLPPSATRSLIAAPGASSKDSWCVIEEDADPVASNLKAPKVAALNLETGQLVDLPLEVGEIVHSVAGDQNRVILESEYQASIRVYNLAEARIDFSRGVKHTLELGMIGLEAISFTDGTSGLLLMQADVGISTIKAITIFVTPFEEAGDLEEYVSPHVNRFESPLFLVKPDSAVVVVSMRQFRELTANCNERIIDSLPYPFSDIRATGRLGMKVHLIGYSASAPIVIVSSVSLGDVTSVTAIAGTYNPISRVGSFIPSRRYHPYPENIAHVALASEIEHALSSFSESAVALGCTTSVPVLLIQGDNDYIGQQQAEGMFTAIAAHGGTVRLIRYGGEGHDLQRADNIRDFRHRVWQWHELTSGLSLDPEIGPNIIRNNDSEVLESVVEIVSKLLGRSTLAFEEYGVPLRDIGLRSAMALDLILEIEVALDIDLSCVAVEASDIYSVFALSRFLTRLTSNRVAGEVL